MSDVVSGRLEATPVDLQQPLLAVETGRPVANRETARETAAAELRASLRSWWRVRRCRFRHHHLTDRWLANDGRWWQACLTEWRSWHV